MKGSTRNKAPRAIRVIFQNSRNISRKANVSQNTSSEGQIYATPRSKFFDSKSNYLNIQTGTYVLAASVRKQVKVFLQSRVKTKPSQHRATSSSPQTFRTRNTTYEIKTNLRHCETSQTPKEQFFDKNTFLDKTIFLEDPTVHPRL